MFEVSTLPSASVTTTEFCPWDSTRIRTCCPLRTLVDDDPLSPPEPLLLVAAMRTPSAVASAPDEPTAEAIARAPPGWLAYPRFSQEMTSCPAELWSSDSVTSTP